MSLTYLASPYTHQDAEVRLARYHAACKKAAELMLAGRVIFCPIAHSHPIAMQMPAGCDVDPDLWKKQDEPYVSMCSEVIVLRLRGWEKSGGVRHEIEEATRRGIPVTYIDYTEHDKLCNDAMGCSPWCLATVTR